MPQSDSAAGIVSDAALSEPFAALPVDASAASPGGEANTGVIVGVTTATYLSIPSFEPCDYDILTAALFHTHTHTHTFSLFPPPPLPRLSLSLLREMQK